LLDELYRDLDTHMPGHQLLEDHGLSFEHPHFSTSTTTSGTRIRRRLNVSLCGDPRGAGPRHRISLFGYDEAGRRTMERLGLSVRPARKGSSGWRYETATRDFGQLAAVIGHIQSSLDVSVRFTARLGARAPGAIKSRNSLPFMPAAAVRPG